MNNAVYKQAYRKSFVHYMGPFIMKKTHHPMIFSLNCQISLSISSICIKRESRLHGSFLLTWKCVKKIILDFFFFFFCLVGSYRCSDILVNIIILSTYIMFICKALYKCLLFNLTHYEVGKNYYPHFSRN